MRKYLKTNANRAKDRDNPSKSRISPYQTILLVLLIFVGLASSILLYIVVSRREQAKIQNNFEIAAQERISIFKEHLKEGIQSLHWLAGLFNSAQKVQRSEFREFTRLYLLDHPEIQALEWIPRVPDSERTAYEVAARKDGFTNFNITQHNQNQIVRAAKREEYFPEFFIEPYKGNEASLGFDIASNSIRLEALKSACDNNQLTVTERIFLIQEASKQSKEQYGALAIQPIYQMGTPKDSIEQRRENLKGFVLVKLNISSFMEALLVHFESFGMEIYLCDASAPKGRCFLGSHLSHTSTNPDKASTELCVCDKLLQATGLYSTDTFDMVNRKWKFLCIPTPDFLAKGEPLLPLIAMISNIVITGLLTLLTLSVFQRINKARQFTTELLASQQILQNEISERKKAEGALKIKQKETEALLTATRTIPERRTFEEAARAIFDAAKELLGADSGYVALLSEDGQENEVLFLDAGGRQCTVDPNLPMLIRGLRAEAYSKRAVVWENNFPVSKWEGLMPDGHVKLDNVLFAPIIIGGKAVGAIGLANKPGGFGEHDAEMARAFSDIAAVGLRFARDHEKLRQSEKKFRKLTETIDDVFWITSLVECEKIEYVSDAFRKIWGKEPEELYKNPRLWTDTIHPDDRRKIVERFEGFIQGINDYDVEYRVLRDDDSIRWVWDRGFKAFDDKNQVTRIMGLAQDITESKKAEETLIESELRFRTLFEQAGDYILLLEISPEGIPIIRDANTSALNIHGYTREEFIGKPITFLDTEVDGAIVKERMQRLLNNEIATFEVKHVRKDSTVFDVEISAKIMEIGSKTYVISIERDITERKKARNKLKKQQYYLTKAQEIGSIGTWELDITKNILTWTDENYRIFGVPMGTELDYKIFLNCVHPDDRDYVNEKWSAAINGEPYDIEHRLVVDGQVKWVREKADMIFDETGKALRGIGFTQDITLFKTAENKLRESEEKLTKAQEMAHFGNWEWDVKADKITWSDEVYRIYGIEPGTLITYNVLMEVIHPDDHEYHNKHTAGWLENHGGDPFEYRVVRPDGSIRFIYGIGEIECDAAGEPVRMFGTLQDITERKKAEEKLKQESLMRKTLLDHIPCIGMILKKGTREIIACNETAKKLGAVVGKTCYESCAKRDKPCPFCRAPKVWTSDEPKRLEVEYEGTYYDGIWVPLTEDWYVHYIFDISERKLAEQKLLDDQAQLKSLASQLSLTEEHERHRLATGLHDQIGQSLVFSKMKVDELRESAPSDELTKALEQVSGYLKQVIGDTRTLTFDLSSPILYDLGLESAVSEWLARQIHEKHEIKTEFVDDGQQKPLHDDIKAILFRNVRELLANVVKHAQANKVKISIHKLNKNIHIDIEDDGVGFDPVKVASTAAEETKFGLFSIRQRLEQLGGHFEIDSESGRGSKFTMTAPLKLE